MAKTTYEITTRTKDILDACDIWVRRHHVFPKVAEIADLFGISYGSAARHFRKLKKHKLIVPTFNRRSPYRLNRAKIEKMEVKEGYELQIGKANEHSGIQ